MDNSAQLIRKCIEGERIAQTQLYQAFAPKMFPVCLRYCKNQEEAEEIIQEGFMKVFQSIGQFRFQGSFEGWIRKIMINTALQKYRHKNHLRPIVSFEDTNIEELGSNNIIGQLEAKELISLIQQLPPAYNVVFNLYVFEGLKHREIAKELGITEGTSKSNLSAARIILQKAITKNMQEAQKNTGYGR